MKNVNIPVLFAALVMTGAVWGMELGLKVGERAEWWPTNAPFRVDAFYPERDAGIYNRGEAPSFILLVNKAPAAKDLVARVDVRPYGGAVEKDVARFPVAEGTNRFALAASDRYGHRTVTVRFSNSDGDWGWSQSACAVLPPEPQKRDPYWVVDKNGQMDLLLTEMKRLGFGGLFLPMPTMCQLLEMDEDGRRTALKGFAKGTRKGLSARTDFHLIGCASPALNGSRTKDWLRRAESGLPALTDEQCALVRGFAVEMSRLSADNIDTWVVQEEYDGHAGYGDTSRIGTNYLQYAAAFGLMTHNIVSGLRTGNPAARIAVLGCYCGDYYNSTPHFAIGRRVLMPIYGKFDMVALDAYSGCWNRTRNRFTPPEDTFADLLRAGANLSAEFGGERLCANVERCAGVDYRAGYDSEQLSDQVENVMRSMIIQRTVGETYCYSYHYSGTDWPFRKQKKRLYDPDFDFGVDMGIWRAAVPDRGRTRWAPRPVAAAVATTTRLLSFVQKGALRRLDEGVYLATFDAPGGEGGESLAACWTMNEPMKVSVVLPGRVKRIDAMGNGSDLAAGKVELRLSGTPFFLKLPAKDRTAFETAISGFRVLSREERTPLAALSVREGELPAEPTFTLAGPLDMQPASAMIPEAGFFRKGAVFPRADVRFAWTHEHFLAEVTVRNKRHVQRRKAGGVRDDDSVLFYFYDVAPRREGREGDPERDRNAKTAVAYLDGEGGHLVVYDPARSASESVRGGCEASAQGETTVYRVRIPWRSVLPTLEIGKGARFAFNMICPFASSEHDWKPAPYRLVLGKYPDSWPCFQVYHSPFLSCCRYLRLD